MRQNQHAHPDRFNPGQIMKKILTHVPPLPWGARRSTRASPPPRPSPQFTSRSRKGATVVPARPPPRQIPFEPKAQTIFSAARMTTNPFWPIGWVKMDDAAVDNAAPLVPHVEDFTVTSILSNEPPIAVINGKEMAEGEVGALPISSGR